MKEELRQKQKVIIVLMENLDLSMLKKRVSTPLIKRGVSQFDGPFGHANSDFDAMFSRCHLSTHGVVPAHLVKYVIQPDNESCVWAALNKIP